MAKTMDKSDIKKKKIYFCIFCVIMLGLMAFLIYANHNTKKMNKEAEATAQNEISNPPAEIQDDEKKPDKIEEITSSPLDGIIGFAFEKKVPADVSVPESKPYSRAMCFFDEFTLAIRVYTATSEEPSVNKIYRYEFSEDMSKLKIISQNMESIGNEEIMKVEVSKDKKSITLLSDSDDVPSTVFEKTTRDLSKEMNGHD